MGQISVAETGWFFGWDSLPATRRKKSQRNVNEQIEAVMWHWKCLTIYSQFNIYEVGDNSIINCILIYQSFVWMVRLNFIIFYFGRGPALSGFINLISSTNSLKKNPHKLSYIFIKRNFKLLWKILWKKWSY